MFAVLLALGLDDKAGGAVIFHQDQVPEHAELAWYLNCVTPVNRLMRMTSWKVSLRGRRRGAGELMRCGPAVEASEPTERQFGGRGGRLASPAWTARVPRTPSRRRAALQVRCSLSAIKGSL